MYTYVKQLVLLIILPSFILSCTEEPANDPGTQEGPPQTEVSGKAQFKSFKDIVATSPDVFTYPGETSGVGSAEEEAKKLENARKPIVYGVGAAGITMDTSLEDSKDLLTPPFRGPFSNGVAFYNEQVIVQWKQEGERKPGIIYISKGYLGSMDGGKFGDLNFKTKFLDYKPEGLAGAQRLTRELYLELEDVSDTSYDCLATGRCRTIFGDVNQPNFVIVLPGAVFLMAKEEFQIAEIRIIRDIDPGLLANNVDLLTGDILIPDEDPFQLGQTYQEVFDRINASPVKASPEVYIQEDSFVYAWNGVYLLFYRSNYGVDVTEAEATDRNYVVQVTGAYPKYLTLGGKRILMNQTLEDISFSLEEMPDPATAAQDSIVVSETEVEYKLMMNTPIRKQDAALFAKKFPEFLSDHLGEYDVLRIRTWGVQNAAKVNKDISVSVSAYHSETLEGVSISFEVSEEQEKMSYIGMGKISPDFGAFSKLTLAASEKRVVRSEQDFPVLNKINNEPVMIQVPNSNYEAEYAAYLEEKAKIEALIEQGEEGLVLPDAPLKMLTVPKMEERKQDYFTELAGIKLNDLVKLEEIDALGRGQATVTYLSGSNELGQVTERAGYSDQGVFNYPEFNKPTPRQQGYVSVTGATLGIKVIGGDENTQYARVVSVTSGSMFKEIQDVCGVTAKSGIKIAMTDDEVVSALTKVINKQKKKNPDFKCDYFKSYDNGSLGILKEIYFPQERLKLVFSDRALVAVTIYMPLSEVDNSLQGVMQ